MGTFKRNIGIIGIAWSGKTVFLTSLIHHLQHHDPEKFPLHSANKKPNPAVSKFERLKLEELDHAVAEVEAEGRETTIKRLARFGSIFSTKKNTPESSRDTEAQIQSVRDEIETTVESNAQRNKQKELIINLSKFNKDVLLGCYL